MKNHTPIFLAAMLVTPTLFASGMLFPMFHAQCFRNSINLCDEGTTWVYTTERLASKCGCVMPKDITTDAQVCDQMSNEDCDQKSGEEFYNLYPASNRSKRIGCGCFTTEKD